MRRLFQDLVSQYVGYAFVLPLRDRQVRRARRLLASKETDHFRTPEEIRAAQEVKLRALLSHCARTVPYYRELFRDVGCDPAAPEATRQLRRLPLLTKNIISEYGEALLSKRGRSSRLWADSSGGSTGKMVNFLQDQHFRDHMMASAWASDRMHGWTWGSRVAYLWGAPRDVTELRRPQARLRLYLENTRTLDAFNMAPARMGEYHRSLEEFKPDVIIAYASSLYLFARYLLEQGITCDYPRISVISSADMLTPEMREQIQRVFRVPIFDRYGSREVGLIASECNAHDGLHVNVSDLYVECVDDAGLPVAENTPGEVTVTVLTNYAMPFVRYRIEDVGVLTTVPCACGRRSPRILRLLGRSSDIIIGSEDRLIHGEYFTHLFYGIPEIRQFQFIQESLQRFRIVLVPADGFNREITRSLEREMVGVLGEGASVTWEVVPSIPPLPSGKHRFTLNRMATEPRRETR